MFYEEFSINELEKELVGIELVEEKIEFISDEILRCEKLIQELQFDINEHIPFEVKFIVQRDCASHQLVDFLNRDGEIKRAVTKKVVIFCKEELCKRNNQFLKRAKLLKEHFQIKLELLIKSNYIHSNNILADKTYNTSRRIVWMSGKEKLLKMFAELKEKNILSEYSTEEILSHFTDENQVPFLKGMGVQRMFRWRGSDSSFAVFVNELAKRNAIDGEEKFKLFLKHFLNKKGKPFRNLAQKKYYTENYSKTGNLIKEILNPINLSVIVEICYNLLSSFMSG